MYITKQNHVRQEVWHNVQSGKNQYNKFCFYVNFLTARHNPVAFLLLNKGKNELSKEVSLKTVLEYRNWHNLTDFIWF